QATATNASPPAPVSADGYATSAPIVAAPRHTAPATSSAGTAVGVRASGSIRRLAAARATGPGAAPLQPRHSTEPSTAVPNPTPPPPTPPPPPPPPPAPPPPARDPPRPHHPHPPPPPPPPSPPPNPPTPPPPPHPPPPPPTHPPPHPPPRLQQLHLTHQTT